MTPWLDDGDVRLYHGDALETLRELPSESVDCVVTSPPYWGLRDYGTGEWDGGDPDCDHVKERTHSHERSTGSKSGVAGHVPNAWARGAEHDDYKWEVCGKCGATRVDRQMGLEPTPDLFVTNMVELFREVRRVLAPHGTCWVNLGSSYFNGESYPLSKINAVWLAAIIDGEGSIQIHRQRRPESTNSVDSFQVDLSVGMMTPEVVQRCHEITRLGSCKQQNRGVWDWSCRGQQAAQLLRAIYPYLLTKKRQAAVAVMLADDLAARRYGRGNPAQLEVMEWRELARQAVMDLNQRRDTAFDIAEPKPIALNLKQKDECGIPHAVYHALRDDGWYARMDIVWGKPNPMPESVTDRPTKAHEYVFLLTKQPRYWFDTEAVREPLLPSSVARGEYGHASFGKGQFNGSPSDERHQDGKQVRKVADLQNPAGRNVRSVWQIATQPYPEAHFATYPEELARRCILAGCPTRVCRVCGKPSERIVELTDEYKALLASPKAWRTNEGKPDAYTNRQQKGHVSQVPTKNTTVGWSDCGHNNWRPGTVLDPFIGSGTTAKVARDHQRHSIGIDLSREYLELAARRLQQLSLLT